jgi:cystathionine beta-lyase
MPTNFDIEIDRRHTGSVKWEFVIDSEDPSKKSRTDACFGSNRILPMWVADMDFPSPEPVVKALQERARHGIFGYTQPDQAYLEAVTGWMKKRHAWPVEESWIVTTQGVVPALHLLVRALTQPGDKILIQQPVYYPFFSAIEKNGCRIVSNSLVLAEGQYHMDYDDLESKTADPDVKLAILCSPHNPVGRVWTREELHRFGHICLRNHVRVISDEIHGDLVYPGVTFCPFSMADSVFQENSIVCTAPSKTFNLAGLQTSNIFIPDRKIRQKFKESLLSNGLFGLNPFGTTACRVAYEEGEPWLEDLLRYLKKNLDALITLFERDIPEIRVIHPQGTYLVWFDCRSLGLDNHQLRNLFLNQARVFLDEGSLFGPEGDGFQRINIACPRPLLMEALGRIVAAIKAPPCNQKETSYLHNI